MRPGGRWSSRSTVVAMSVSAATITALIVGGIALADNGSGTDDKTPTATASPKAGARFGGLGRLRGKMMLGRPLHGEFVVAKQGGGYQTVATQQGKVQSVSSSSITLKSEDGYTKTYAIDGDTLVNARRDGIESVKKDDTVGVAAVVDGDGATAVRVADVSLLKDTWKKFRPHRQGGFGGGGGAPGDEGS
jgi:hypothetical protein